MSVMTTGRPGRLARVTALPRPPTDEENASPAGVSRPGQWPGGQWAGQERADQAGEPGRAPRPGETRHAPDGPGAAAFRHVTGHRQVREFRQVREVQLAREFRVVRAAAGGGVRLAAPGSRLAAAAPGRAARPPAQRGGVRLTRRGRVVVTVLLTTTALLVMVLVWLTAAARAQATDSGPPPGAVYRNLTSVVVHPGQSLWSIASQAQPSADPRMVMQEIVDLNALHGTSLVPGQRLWVPRR
jgi:LysM domain